MAAIRDCWWTDNGEHRWLVFSWSAGNVDFAETLDALKRLVPSDLRSWDEERKVWSVREDAVETILPLFRNLAGKLDGIASQGVLL